jgi:4-nitrophenyl phosphatase
LDRYDTWMFDCDGVLWHRDRIVDGALEVLDTLRRKSTSVPLIRYPSTYSCPIFFI